MSLEAVLMLLMNDCTITDCYLDLESLDILSSQQQHPTMSARWFSPSVKLCFPAEASWLCLNTKCTFFSHTALLKSISVWNTNPRCLIQTLPEYVVTKTKCLFKSYLIIINFSMFGFPLFPQFVHSRRRTGEDHEGQKQHSTQSVHTEKEGEKRKADVILV